MSAARPAAGAALKEAARALVANISGGSNLALPPDQRPALVAGFLLGLLNLLVVPVADSVMYFEPLYLQADQNAIPELTRVIVAYNDKVVMEPTLSDALLAIFGPGAAIGPTTSTSGGGTTTTTGGGATTTTTPGSTTTTTPGSTTSTTLGTGTTLPTDPAQLIALANSLYQQALQAQRDGDWAEYGQLIDRLGQVLAALQAAQGK